MSDELRVSAAHEFKPVAALMRLPSGRVVRVKEVDLVSLIVSNSGDVPDFISRRVLAGMNGQRAPGADVTKDNAAEVFGFINTLVLAAVVEPRVVAEDADYDAGEINVCDLSTDDKTAIVAVVMPQEVGIAESFRERVKAANMELVPSEQNNRGKTKRGSGAKK